MAEMAIGFNVTLKNIKIIILIKLTMHLLSIKIPIEVIILKKVIIEVFDKESEIKNERMED